MNIVEETIWVAKTTFNKGLAHGSSGNISFRKGDDIYVSKSGSCFGIIDDNSFAKISSEGNVIDGKPSKEWPMHLKLYEINDNTSAVIHTHSFHSAVLSCVEDIEKRIDDLMSYTPYLKMQCNGNINVVDFAKPGSEELFNSFYKVASKETNIYILRNHGIFVASSSPLKAFYLLEEFEQTAKIYLSINKDLKFMTIA